MSTWLTVNVADMAAKPQGGLCRIKEQIIEDPVTGLTFQFELRDDGSTKLRIYGDLSNGNREFVFDAEGEDQGSGTFLGEVCRPSWLKKVG